MLDGVTNEMREKGRVLGNINISVGIQSAFIQSISLYLTSNYTLSLIDEYPVWYSLLL